MKISVRNGSNMITPEKARDIFNRILKKDFGIMPDQAKSVKIKDIRAALRKIDTQLQSDQAKVIARLELKDMYQIAGGHVSSKGNIRYDF